MKSSKSLLLSHLTLRKDRTSSRQQTYLPHVAAIQLHSLVRSWTLIKVQSTDYKHVTGTGVPNGGSNDARSASKFEHAMVGKDDG